MTDAADSGGFDVAALAQAMLAGTVDEFLRKVFIGDDQVWDELVDAAAEAHRRGEMDLTGLLEERQEPRVSPATQQFLEQVLPKIDLSFARLVELSVSPIVREEDGSSPYWFIEAVARWCQQNPERPGEALEAIEAGSAPADLTRAVLVSGLKVNRVGFLPLLLSRLPTGLSTLDLASAVLGRFDAFDSAEVDTVAAALSQAVRASHGEHVVEPLRALLALANRYAAAVPVAQRCLDDIASRVDQHVRRAIAVEMSFVGGASPQPLAATALALLLGTGADERAAIDAIDHILSRNLAGPLAVPAAALGDRLLTTGGATIKRLDSYAHRLLADKAGALSAAVTRWLLADTARLHMAVRDVCLEVYGDPIIFDLDFSSARLTPERSVRIARHASGTLMLAPESAASIIVSLMRTAAAEAIAYLAELLFDPLLISYWAGPRKYLEGVLPSVPTAAADAIRGAVERLDRYASDVEKARDLPELRPSQRHRYIAAVKRHEEQIAIGKAAREGSIFASIMPMSVMLFGDSAVYDMIVEEGKSIRQETPMGVHEIEHALPRLDVIDPFGTWYKRLQLIQDGGEQ